MTLKPIAVGTLFLCLFTEHLYAKTHVYFQNSTTMPLEVTIAQSGSQLDQNDEWAPVHSNGSSQEAMSLKKELLWFNRNYGIKSGQTYFFTVTLRTITGDTVATLTQKLKGTWRLSDMWFQAQAPSESTGWQQGHTIRSIDFELAGQELTLQMAGRRNYSEATDDIIYVLHEKNPYGNVIKNTKSSSSELTIIGYNIFGVKTNLPDDIFNRAKAAAATLADNPVDVIVFSEAFNGKSRDYLKEHLKSSHPYASRTVGIDSTSLEDGGVFILSRFPFEVEEELIYADCSGYDCLAAKGSKYISIQKGSETYHVFGTHLQADQDSTAISARKSQIESLARFIDDQEIPSTDAVFVVGDLNIDPEKNADQWSHLVSTLGAVSVPLATYSHPYSIDSSKNHLAGSQELLDFVLYLKDKRQPSVSDQAILMMRSADHNLFGSSEISDHFPVYGWFKY